MLLYQEYAPRPALRPYLACLWTCRAGAGFTHRVLPDNGIDILWQDRQDASFAVGMMRRAIEVHSAGLVRTVAVRFKPGAAAYFFDLPIAELNDQRAGLDQLWGRACAGRLADDLWSDDLSDLQRLDLLERHLLARLPGQYRHGLLDTALAAIEASGGQVRIATLARGLDVSRQHLASQFRARVGLTPKMFARICRFQRVTQEIKASGMDWPQLALAHGYADQAHLIHEFQELAGASPASFAASRI
ncbi:AraC-like DNA-binding protein [Oxalobacteraceae bacterium GrIS 1.11]